MEAAITTGQRHRWIAPRAQGTLLLALTLAAAALFLFVDARTVPIILWDESRNVVNALEMRRAGLGLVTTYGFAPDLWNTKPPLLIWLMTASVSAFGTSEWSLRLPSALAALGTLLIVMLFTRRATGSAGTGALAGAILALSPGFFGEHGARTADYDALLTFLTTAYLRLLFFALHRAKPRIALLVAIGLLIAGAVLTKSSAGLLPGAGVAAYLLWTRRLTRAAASWRYAAMAAAALFPVALFLAAREALAPGYVEAALHNDLLGRFNQSLVRREGPPWYYLRALLSGWFVAGPFLLALPIGYSRAKGKSRAALTFFLFVAGAQLALVSVSSTKLLHYALPAFPPLAIAAAILMRALFDALMRRRTGLAARGATLASSSILLAAAAAALLPTARALEWRFDRFPARQFYPQASYGELFSKLARSGVRRVGAADPGFALAGDPHYVPLLRSYQLIWQDRGLLVSHLPRLPTRLPRGTVWASCDPATAALLRQRGRDIGGVPGCAAIRSAR